MVSGNVQVTGRGNTVLTNQEECSCSQWNGLIKLIFVIGAILAVAGILTAAKSLLPMNHSIALMGIGAILFIPSLFHLFKSNETSEKPAPTSSIVPSSRIVEKTMPLSDAITSVTMWTAATLIISHGERSSLTISANENVIELLTPYEISKGLDLNVRSEQSLGNCTITYKLTLCSLDRLVIYGSGKAEIDKLYSNQFICDVHGKCDVLVKEGRLGSQNITIAGVGTYDASSVECQLASVQITGATAGVHLCAAKKLTVTITGSGNIYYSGNPTLSTTTSGNGQIIKQDRRV